MCGDPWIPHAQTSQIHLPGPVSRLADCTVLTLNHANGGSSDSPVKRVIVRRMTRECKQCSDICIQNVLCVLPRQVANQFYTDTRGDWEVLVLDLARLTSEVKFEPAAPVGAKPAGGLSSGGPAGNPPEFPHLYGPIDPAALVRRLAVTRGNGGKFLDVHH